MTIKTKTPHGFTLIELLVAVGIVAVIAAVLLPVFGAVRERGRRTTCQSNLKQIALATQQYVQDNDGVYPGIHNWALAADSYAKNMEIFRCPDAPLDEPTVESLVDFSCVAAPCSVNHSYDVSHPINYHCNFQRLTTLSTLPKPISHGNQEAVLVTPSTIWLNMDAWWIDESVGAIYRYGRPVSTSCGRDFLGSTLHSGAGNYSYVDGHVKWLTPEEAGEIECANGPLPAPFKD